MSKKSKRAKSKTRFIKVDKQHIADHLKPNTTPTIAQIKTLPKTLSPVVSVKEAQYQYLRPELIRISIIAGIFFLILIIASVIVK